MFDGKSVLFVGRFVYRKELRLLLEAMKRVVDEKVLRRNTVSNQSLVA